MATGSWKFSKMTWALIGLAVLVILGVIGYTQRPLREAPTSLVSPLEKVEVSRAQMNKYFEDLPATLMAMSMVPERDTAGEIHCFKLTEVQPASLADAVTLKVGDCLKAINDMVATSPQAAMEIYSTLKNADKYTVTFLRDGEERRLEIVLK